MKKIARNFIIGGVAAAAVAGGLIYFLYPDSVSVEQAEKAGVKQSISIVGHIEADAAVTVYAPVNGIIDKVSCKVNDSVKKGDALAEYDMTSLEDTYRSVALNSDYYEDMYQAAVTENNSNRARVNEATNESEVLKRNYISIEEQRDAISDSEQSRTSSAQSSINSIEAEIDNLKVNMETLATKLGVASSEYSELNGKLLEAGAEIHVLEEKILKTNEKIAGYKTEQAKYEEDSDEYKEYAACIEEETENLNAATAERDARKTVYDSISAAADTAKADKESLEKQLAELEKKITDNRKKLGSISTSEMTPEQYARYEMLNRQLDLAERDWQQSIEKKTTAEEKILNNYQIKQYADQADIAKADEEKALRELNKAKGGIVSALAGTVIERYIDDGAVVEAGTPLFLVQPGSGYKVSVMISRYDIESIEIGQKATVKVGEKEYEGTVSVIAPVATEDTSGKPRVKVEIALTDRNAAPTIGIEADVTIETAEEEDVLSVPTDAVYIGDEGSYVYVLENREVAKRFIKTGISGSDRVQITDGLKEGETVIVTPVTDDAIGSKMIAGKNQ